MASAQPTSGIIETILALLVKSPQLLSLLGARRLSGQVWLYLFMAYAEVPERRIKYLNNHIGITILGVISFIPEFIITYYFVHGFGLFDFDLSLQLVLTTIIFSFLAQACIFIIVVMRARS